VPRATLPGLLLLLLAAPGGVSAVAGEADLLEAAVRDLASPRAEARRQALAALDGLTDERPDLGREAVQRLRDLARRRPSTEGAVAVRILARASGDLARSAWLEALGGTKPPELFLAAIEGARDRSADVQAGKALLDRARAATADPLARALAIEALGAIGGAAARVFLTRPVPPANGAGEEEWLLAAARARGLARWGEPEAVPPLLALLDHADPAVRIHAGEALVDVTGARLPPEAGPWRSWWAEAAGRLPVRDRAAGGEDGAPVAHGRYAGEGPPPLHVPRYYGIPIARRGSRVVFCLDVSQSMYGRGIDQARRHLAHTIRDLPGTHAFAVVAFNENVLPFPGGIQPAHPVVKARALAWIAALETTSYTNLYDAVETAFGFGGMGPRALPGPARVDEVFLLSDGAPNRGRHRQEDRVVEAIAALGGGRVPVHAIAAGEEVFPLLRRIAERTGGRFVDAFEWQ
jgi:hypothetical protein